MALVTFPHGPLTQLASNLWLVQAQTSQGLDRKMTVVRGPSGELFLHDTLWLDPQAFAALEALGTVTTIFVTSYLHDFDGERFAARYPGAKFCGTPGTVKKLAWPGLVPFAASMAPAGLTLTRIPGVKGVEVLTEVQHPEGGASLVFGDSLFNLPHAGGLRGTLLRLAGSSGPLHMTPLARLFLLERRDAFRSWLESQAKRTDLRHLIVSHGAVISDGASAQLAAAAARL